MKWLGPIKNDRGLSAVSLSLMVVTGMTAVGVGVSMMVTSASRDSLRQRATEMGNQTNSAALSLASQLISSQALVKREVAGQGEEAATVEWTSAMQRDPSSRWFFIPKQLDVPNSPPARIQIRACDPRFSRGNDPQDLAACPGDHLITMVTFNREVNGKQEVTAATRIPLYRDTEGLNVDKPSHNVMVVTRALLSNNLPTCTGVDAVPSDSVQVGQEFDLVMRDGTYSPSNATITLITGATGSGGSSSGGGGPVPTGGPVPSGAPSGLPTRSGSRSGGSTGTPFTGTPPTLRLRAPAEVGEYRYLVRVSTPAGNTVCPARVIRVVNCKEYVSDEPIKELYRTLLRDNDGQVTGDPGVATRARQVADGSVSILSHEAQLRRAGEYFDRGANHPAPPDPSAGILGEYLTTIYLMHFARGGSAAEFNAPTAWILRPNGLKATFDHATQSACLFNPNTACTPLLTIPKIVTQLRASPEFNARGRAYDVSLVNWMYRRMFRRNPDAAGLAFWRDRFKDGITSLKATEDQIRLASPEYQNAPNFGEFTEQVTAMSRVILGDTIFRNSTQAEIDQAADDMGKITELSSLMKNFGATRGYVAARLKTDDNRWVSSGGCPVPRPRPMCQITSTKNSLGPNEPYTLTLNAFHNLTSVRWDGTNYSPPAVGGYAVTSNRTSPLTAQNIVTTATVTNSEGSYTCSLTIPVKRSCTIWQARRGPGPGSRWSSTYGYPYYNEWGAWIPGIPASDFCFSTNYNQETGYEYCGPQSPIVFTTRGAYDPCNRAADQVACLADRRDMPVFWTNPADSVRYQFMERPSDGAAVDYYAGGACGSDDCECWVTGITSPLVIDVDGKGIELNATAYFNLEDQGPEYFMWPSNGKNSMLLALDRNNNGKIDDFNEIFGNYTKGPDGKREENGFEALKKYDNNKDGLIDSNDPIYSKLVLWGDEKNFGTTDPNELHSLPSKKVKAIDLKYLNIDERADKFGNFSRQRSIADLTTGEMRRVVDLWFAPGNPNNK